MQRSWWTAVVVLVLAGCGDTTRAPTASDPGATTTAVPASPRYRPPGPAEDAEVRSSLHLPARVPLRPYGDAEPGRAAIVRRWLDAITEGHPEQAARLFALPARLQNFATVARLRTRADALQITASLPCGARYLRAGGGGHSRDFVVYDARLVERPGGHCGTGVGGIVRGAVRVVGGRIVEWYRLPDLQLPPQLATSPTAA
jgi:hypothetical protein